MAAPKLVSVRRLKNHGVVVSYRRQDGTVARRFERPDGKLSFLEAARLLRTTAMRLYRAKERGQLTTMRQRGVVWIPLPELRRVRSVGLLALSYPNGTPPR